jgi:hypothetical protein
METRWILLGADGRHISLGRQSDPTDTEVRQAEAALAAAGQVGWLVILRGDYYARRTRLELLAVRPLAGAPKEGWAAAVAAFEKKRCDAFA